MTKPVLILDVDNVLLDHRVAFIDWMKRVKGIDVCLKSNPADPYDLLSSPEISENKKQEYIGEFNESQFFGRLSVIDGAAKGVRILALNYMDRFSHIAALSSCGTAPITVELRSRQMRLEFPDISEIICLRRSSSKHHALMAFPHKSVLVDDSIGHMNEAWNAGITAILFDCQANLHHDWGKYRMNGWDNAVSAINQALT